MQHCTYRVYHPLTGYYYIGKGDLRRWVKGNYWGSGRRINDAYKKYPQEQWVRELLGSFSTSDEAYLAESQLVTSETLQDPRCLNLVPGGRGNNSRKHTVEERLAKSLRQKGKARGRRTPETALRISLAKKGKKPKPRFTIVCPHCAKSGDSAVMQRWHMDKCLENPHLDAFAINTLVEKRKQTAQRISLAKIGRSNGHTGLRNQ